MSVNFAILPCFSFWETFIISFFFNRSIIIPLFHPFLHPFLSRADSVVTIDVDEIESKYDVDEDEVEEAMVLPSLSPQPVAIDTTEAEAEDIGIDRE